VQLWKKWGHVCHLHVSQTEKVAHVTAPFPNRDHAAKRKLMHPDPSLY